MTQFAAVLQIQKKWVYRYLYNTALSLSQPVTHWPSCLIHLSVNVTTSVHPHCLSQKVQAGEQLMKCWHSRSHVSSVNILYWTTVQSERLQSEMFYLTGELLVGFFSEVTVKLKFQNNRRDRTLTITVRFFPEEGITFSIIWDAMKCLCQMFPISTWCFKITFALLPFQYWKGNKL